MSLVLFAERRSAVNAWDVPVARPAAPKDTARHVAPTYDEAALPDIKEWFENNYSIQFSNYPVGDEYLHLHEVVPTRA